MRDAPPITEELIEHLSKRFPLEKILEDTSLEAVQRVRGQHEVLAYLKACHRRQTELQGRSQHVRT